MSKVLFWKGLVGTCDDECNICDLSCFAFSYGNCSSGVVDPNDGGAGDASQVNGQGAWTAAKVKDNVASLHMGRKVAG